MGEEIFIPGFEDVSVFTSYLPPVGDYLCEIKDIPQFKTTKNENPQLTLKLTIITSKKPELAAEEGHVIVDFITFSVTDPKKCWRLKQLLVSAGALEKDDKTTQLARGQLNTEVFVGLKPTVRVTHRMYEGQVKADIEYLIGG